jgi:flagellar hook-basal body complex protein FliE
MMEILQVDPINGAGTRLVEYGALGVMVLGLAFGLWNLVKYIKEKNKSEVDRLTKESDDKNSQVNILYTEIKNLQSEQSDKLTDLLIKSNEMNNQVVIALDNSTAALNNNSQIINKILDKL